MRLIDADLIESNIREFAEDRGQVSPLVAGGLLTAADMVAEAPTIDPVRHGKWEYAEDEVLDDLIFSAWKCSCCGYYAYKPGIWHYCPNCGARMLIGDEEVD